MKIELLSETSSTNDTIKEYLPARENIALCAERQTGGKGTKGRAFLSDMGGVYCSFLTFYRDFPATRAFEIMMHAATSVCRTVEQFGVTPEIKWPNDVLVNGKKLCGILIENGFAGGSVDHSIVGIGVNATNDVSALGGIATSLKETSPMQVTVEEVRNALIENYCQASGYDDYLHYVRFLGRPIFVTEGGREYEAVARRILPDGRLEIEAHGEVRALSSAELRLSPKSFHTV